MKRRIVVVGVAMLVVMGSLGWATAGKEEAPAPQQAPSSKSFLEVGKSYVFTLPPTSRPEELTGKVVEAPRENWVKVEAQGEALCHWVNLNTVSVITPLPGSE
jgi:hypothetical protein